MKKAAGKTKCICPQCPSYDSCSGKNEHGFCFTGKSVCISEEKGCICMTCPVQKQFKFDKAYYCTRGSYKKQVR